MAQPGPVGSPSADALKFADNQVLSLPGPLWTGLVDALDY